MPLLFLDIEASSLSGTSYPIEVGWVHEDGQGESHLVRPESTWTDWDPAAEKLHGITRAQLCESGMPATEVAQRLVACLGSDGCALVSDSPQTDGVWLGRLMMVAGRQPLPLLDFDALCGEELRRLIEAAAPKWSLRRAMREQDIRREGQEIYDSVRTAEAMKSRVRHRALPDAQGLWWRWRRIRERVMAWN